MLADPNFSYPVAIDGAFPRAGLILTLEEHRFTDTPQGRLSGSIPGWSVDRIKRLGADGVKVLVWYRPDASAEVRAHQQAYVRQVGRDCAAHDIPFVLELLVHPFARVAAERAEYAEDPARHPQMVIDSVREFARPDYGVDLLKLESPVPAALLPPDSDAAGTSRVQGLFDSLGEAAGGLPWVMLSAGAGKADFQRVLRFAYRAGASGFLAGRAIWADAMAAFPDIEGCRAALRASGVPYMRALAALTAAEARGWRCAYDDLGGIGREGAFAAAVPALGATEDERMSETDPHKAMPDFSVRGQHAVITGGTGGIGGAFARAFAAHGATVTITDLREPRARCRPASLHAHSTCATMPRWRRWPPPCRAATC